ncbi:MAG: hypothetical protein CL920_27260 [Deltaproteobacteria bacterium]|nr:hypothetical protein [Deltaproteobacteria bacterium]MBU52410.1 hypothetical protein [Deltaproteobacteria bacterium]|tara:strand:+ start:6290 stop:6694 length:405 start_codon:yes stop_codon:yes gene_type:complete
MAAKKKTALALFLLLVVFGGGFVSGIVAYQWMQVSAPRRPKRMGFLKRLKIRLDLSEQQFVSVKKVLKSFRPKYRTMRKENRKRLRTLREQMRADIQTLLNDSQKAEFKIMIDAYKKRKADRRKRRRQRRKRRR